MNPTYRLCLLQCTFFILFLCVSGRALPEGATQPLRVNFQPPQEPVPEGYRICSGQPYSASRGFGWSRDIGRQMRAGRFPEQGTANSYLELRSDRVREATFIADVPDGEYLVVVESDDPYGSLSLRDANSRAALELPRRSFTDQLQFSLPVVAQDHQIRLIFAGGRKPLATCRYNALEIYPRQGHENLWQSASRQLEQLEQEYRAFLSAQETRRGRERAEVEAFSLTVPRHQGERVELEMTGSWLFIPQGEVLPGEDPADPASADDHWHPIAVPESWDVTGWWLYTEDFGACRAYLEQERSRCERLTFDYRTTDAGWYRARLEIPPGLENRRFFVQFEAVAALARAWWNGHPVGSHVGKFGPFEFEVTPYVRAGENLLTVFVSAGQLPEGIDKEKVIGTQVTVEVTEGMLAGLPGGFFDDGLRGIWRPVRLLATGPCRIHNLYFQPRLDGAKVSFEIDCWAPSPEARIAQIRLFDAASGERVYEGPRIPLMSDTLATLDLRMPAVKLWSPEHPYLYILEVDLMDGAHRFDRDRERVGFRTFEARGNRLYLNGRPYFLRGANMPPFGLGPNDERLARKFLTLMHEGNQRVTRSHCSPFPELWCRVADEVGVAVSIEGFWPWAMNGQASLPRPEQLEVWRNDWEGVLRRLRNHPCVILWTVNNEMNFHRLHWSGKYGDPDAERRRQKWGILSDVVRLTRRVAPDRPIVASSCYIRTREEFEQELQPRGLDDGDIDDLHNYTGWYEPSGYVEQVASFERVSTGDRPLISQEPCTGYPDGDTGHPIERYLYDHQTPQAWVGSYADRSESPRFFLQVQAELTRAWAEKVRRDKQRISGWLGFCNSTWFAYPHDPERLQAYPVYFAYQEAMRPILLSLDNENRHSYEQERFSSSVAIVNDDVEGRDIEGAILHWRIGGPAGQVLAEGKEPVPVVPYYATERVDLSFLIPGTGRARETLHLDLKLEKDGERLSEASIPFGVFQRGWWGRKETVSVYLKAAEEDFRDSLACFGVSDTGDREERIWLYVESEHAQPGEDLILACRDGKTLVWLNAAERFLTFYDQHVRPVLSERPELVLYEDRAGEYLRIPSSHPIREGLEPLDLRRWNGDRLRGPRICDRMFQFGDFADLSVMGDCIVPHGYLSQPSEVKKYRGSPLFQIRLGKGRVVVSSLRLAEDPLAHRLHYNLIRYLNQE